MTTIEFRCENCGSIPEHLVSTVGFEREDESGRVIGHSMFQVCDQCGERVTMVFVLHEDAST